MNRQEGRVNPIRLFIFRCFYILSKCYIENFKPTPWRMRLNSFQTKFSITSCRCFILSRGKN